MRRDDTVDNIDAILAIAQPLLVLQHRKDTDQAIWLTQSIAADASADDQLLNAANVSQEQAFWQQLDTVSRSATGYLKQIANVVAPLRANFAVVQQKFEVYQSAAAELSAVQAVSAEDRASAESRYITQLQVIRQWANDAHPQRQQYQLRAQIGQQISQCERTIKDYQQQVSGYQRALSQIEQRIKISWRIVIEQRLRLSSCNKN